MMIFPNAQLVEREYTENVFQGKVIALLHAWRHKHLQLL